MRFDTQYMPNWAPRLAGIACLLFLYYQLFNYLGFQSRHSFNSDDAVLNMLAGEMFRYGSVLPGSWITANGDLMFPSGTLIIAPLLHFFPNGYELHAAVSVLLSAVFLFSVHRALKVFSPNYYFLPMAIFASGVSLKFTLMVFLQTTYFWWACAFFLTITSLAKNRFSHSSINVLIFVALVSAVVGISNPGRSLLMYVMPSVAFVAAYHFPSRPTASALAPALWRVFAVLLGWAGAWLFYKFIFRLGLSSTVDHAAAIHVADSGQARSNFVIFLNGWVDYLGVDATAFTGASLTGFYLAVCSGLVLLFSSIGPIWWATSPSTEHRVFDFHRAMALAFFASFIPVFVLYVFFEPLAVNSMTIRYFTTPISILFFGSSVCIGAWLSSHRILGLIITTLLLVSICWTSFVRYKVQSTGFFSGSSLTHMAEELKGVRVNKGYATYWNASSVTILTSEQVKVRPVELTPTAFRQYPVMVSRDWYVQESGPSFLLLTDDEAKVHMPLILKQFGQAKKMISSHGYQIRFYDHDLAKQLPDQ